MRSETMTNEQLVEAVAVEVMGWTLRIGSEPAGDDPLRKVVHAVRYKGKVLVAKPTKIGPSYTDWNPLADHNHAMQVVEKMRERGWFYTIADSAPLRSGRGNRKGKHFVRFFIRRTCKHAVTGDSLPRCICEAALAAVKGEGE